MLQAKLPRLTKKAAHRSSSSSYSKVPEMYHWFTTFFDILFLEGKDLREQRTQLVAFPSPRFGWQNLGQKS